MAAAIASMKQEEQIGGVAEPGRPGGEGERWGGGWTWSTQHPRQGSEECESKRCKVEPRVPTGRMALLC